MSATTYLRFLREGGGDAHRALLIACAAYDYMAANISCGLVRAAPVAPVRPPKPVIEALDVPPASEDAAD
jgi:hypothetical protein